MIAICETFYFASYMQQNLQSEDLEKEKACDEPTQGKIVTHLWYLECLMVPVCELDFFFIYTTFRQYS